MNTFFGILFLIVVCVIPAYDVIVSHRRLLNKILWILGIFIFPFIGALVYLFVGRKTASVSASKTLTKQQ